MHMLAVFTIDASSIRLLDVKIQESYYHKIVARYMQFCTQHSKNLEEAFIERIKTRKWATDQVKQTAIDKVHAMGIKIGLPTDPMVTDPRVLKDYYSDVVVTKSFVLNALILARSRVSKNW